MSNISLVIQESDKQVVELVKQQIARGASDLELRYFVSVCNRMGLDPFTKQIWAIKRWDSSVKNFVLGVQVGIDGFRSVANRSGKYCGQVGPWWCGKDGIWKDVWIDDAPPVAAKVGVLRSDFKEPIFAIVKYEAVVQLTKEKNPNAFWSKMPDHMLAKCAESQALRKAFPVECHGVYTEDESGNEPEPETIGPSKRDFARMERLIAKTETPTEGAKEESTEQQFDSNPQSEQPIEKPIVNYAPAPKTNCDDYRLRFAFGNFKKGLSFAEIGMKDLNSLRTQVMGYALKLDEQGKPVHEQIKEFIELSEQYMEKHR